MNMIYIIYNTTMTESDSYIALLLFIKIKYRNIVHMVIMNFQRGQTYKLNYTSIPFLLLVFPLLMNTISKTANIKYIIPNITGIKIAATLLE